MIELYDDWLIRVDSMNYSLIRIMTNQKTGEKYEKVVGYFGSLSGALKRFRGEIIRGRLQSRSQRLTDALNAIYEEDNRLVEFIEGHTDGIDIVERRTAYGKRN